MAESKQAGNGSRSNTLHRSQPSSSNHDPNKRPALVLASSTAFLTPFMGSSVNIALPVIARDFVMDAVMLSWVATSFLVSAAIFPVPFGRLADIHGRKRIFAYGIAIYTLSALLAAISVSGAMLIAARILQGFGSAMVFAVYIGRVQITPANYPIFMKSIRAAFAIFAIWCFAGIFASLARGKVR